MSKLLKIFKPFTSLFKIIFRIRVTDEAKRRIDDAEVLGGLEKTALKEAVDEMGNKIEKKLDSND